MVCRIMPLAFSIGGKSGSDMGVDLGVSLNSMLSCAADTDHLP